ncbi:MAG TPA: hypothetical protein VH475_02075, partial [Tepidisphaeraceae bacterium]
FAGQVAAANKALTDLQGKVQVEEQTSQRNLQTAQAQIKQRDQRLAIFRPSAKDAIVRNVDATITQVAPDSICYINLGFGDHVTPGLTFEVYDRLDGVPKMNDSDVDLPKGKASIEIISVGQNSSQCRVLRTQLGTQLQQGDVCANLVYDRNTKLTFYVYGKFDMDNNGVATEPEAEVVKNIITRWGGKIADRLSVDVDCVVMGKEPTVPLYSPEELQQPIQKAKYDEAKAALDAYDKVHNDAVSLYVPIMNQTRFLYYTGYFDASKR